MRNGVYLQEKGMSDLGDNDTWKIVLYSLGIIPDFKFISWSSMEWYVTLFCNSFICSFIQCIY